MTADNTRRVDVVRTHLEICDLRALRAAPSPREATQLERVQLSADDYRALYTHVGARWHWRDRLLLADEELDAYLASPDVHVWTLAVGDQRAGYFELQRYQDMRVEIMYFGLAPAFIGRGLGGWMLTRAVEEAFALAASHVTLHTCTLDSSHALPNYLARGFAIVREEHYVETLEGGSRAPGG